jgi:hypothetical protein
LISTYLSQYNGETAAYDSTEEIAEFMTALEMRKELHQRIDQLSPEQLALLADFLEFLQFKHFKSVASTSLVQAGEPVLTGSTIKDLLQFTGTWEGDDFEECLQGVYDTRLPAEF